MARRLIPSGGNDRVYTPRSLAKAIIGHFRPTGRILDPCRGHGAFSDQMPGCAWCEIDEGRDFFAHHDRYDWIVTNPPYSLLTRFLTHAMGLSDNVVFLVNLNAVLGVKSRLNAIRDAGFGLREIVLVETPKLPWPQMGLQLGGVHVAKGATGWTKTSLDPIWTRSTEP